MLRISLARAQREQKTAYIAAHTDTFAFFAAVRYDLRHLLRYAAAALAVLTALRSPRHKRK